MRKVVFAMAVLGSATVLFAADAFEGSWKLNSTKSKFTEGSAPRDEMLVIAVQGDQFQVSITGTDQSGSPISVKYTAPMNGGAGKVIDGPYDGISASRIDANTRETIYLKGGKEVRSGLGVASKDGKTMRVTVIGKDAAGKPVAGVMVFDRQ